MTGPDAQPDRAAGSPMGGPTEDSRTSSDTGPGVPELVSLLMTTRSVQDFLGELATAAGRALNASCGITMRRDGQPMTVASSDALANQVDEVQYGTGQGPCLQSLATGQVVAVPDLASERRWGGYPPHALAYGIASSLSLPMSSEGQTIAALNLYSRTAHAFDEPAERARSTALAAQGSAVLRQRGAAAGGPGAVAAAARRPGWCDRRRRRDRAACRNSAGTQPHGAGRPRAPRPQRLPAVRSYGRTRRPAHSRRRRARRAAPARRPAAP